MVMSPSPFIIRISPTVVSTIMRVSPTIVSAIIRISPAVIRIPSPSPVTPRTVPTIIIAIRTIVIIPPIRICPSWSYPRVRTIQINIPIVSIKEINIIIFRVRNMNGYSRTMKSSDSFRIFIIRRASVKFVQIITRLRCIRSNRIICHLFAIRIFVVICIAVQIHNLLGTIFICALLRCSRCFHFFIFFGNVFRREINVICSLTKT